MTATAEATVAAVAPRALSSPYQGLVPFSAEDARYFFGRDADREIILANLIASRLTLLYAPSGVGKTSVLLAGVCHDLVEPAGPRARLGRGFLPVVMRRWSGDPVQAIDDAVREAVAHRTGAAVPPAAGRLVDRLGVSAEAAEATLLLILDQFEEFLLYHGEDWGEDGAAAHVADVLRSRTAPVNVLLGLREDALASLDRFKGRVPKLFDNYLRLAHLDADAARQAITGPIERWNEDHDEDPWTVEPQLAERVIDEVTTGRITLGRTGAGAVDGRAGGGVEAPFLQLVMMRLWERELAVGSRSLRLETLESLGGAAKLVQTHLDVRMRQLPRRQRDVAAAVFHQLVTPSGSKVARNLQDLAGLTDVPAERIEPVLETLSSGDWRVVRRVSEPGDATARYEVFHDVLADAVLDWRIRHQERRRRARLLRFAALAALAVVAAVVVVVVFERQADKARANELVARSRAALTSDPLDALAKAAEAVSTRRTSFTVEALRVALGRVEARDEIKVGRRPRRLASFRISPDGRMLATASHGVVRMWMDQQPADPVEIPVPGVRTVAFSPDAALLATAGARTAGIAIWRTTDGHRVGEARVGGDVKTMAWAPSGRTLVAVGEKKTLLWDVGTKPPGKVDATARAVVWSPGGSRFATAATDGHVRVWDRTGRRVADLPARGPVEALAFADRGSDVVAARHDGRIDDLSGRRCRLLPRGSEVRAAAFSADGARVALAADDGLHVADLRERCGRATLLATPPYAATRAMAFSQDGQTVVAAAGDGGARVWDIPSRQQVATLVGTWKDNVRLALRPDPDPDGSQVVIAAGDDGRIREWRVGSIPIARLRRDALLAASFRGTGEVVAGTTTGVLAYDVHGGGAPRRIGARQGVAFAAISPGGDRVAIGTAGGGLELLRVSDGSREPLGPAGSKTRLAFSDDGRTLVAAGLDGVQRWDTASATPTTITTSARFAPAAVPAGGDAVVVVDRRVRLYEDGSSRMLALGDLAKAAGKDEKAVAVARGRLLVAAPIGYPPAVWRLDGNDPPRPLEGSEPVSSAAIAPDGAVIATAGPQGLRLWNAATGEPLATLAARPFVSVAFSDDGKSLVAGPEAVLPTSNGDGLGDTPGSVSAGAEIYPCQPCGGEAAILARARRLTSGAPVVRLGALPTAPSDRGTAGPSPVERASTVEPDLSASELAAPPATPQSSPIAATPLPAAATAAPADGG